MIDLMFRFVHI